MGCFPGAPRAAPPPISWFGPVKRASLLSGRRGVACNARHNPRGTEESKPQFVFVRSR